MNTNPIELKISDYTATNLAVAADEGEKVYQLIRRMLLDYQIVILDFSDIALLTTAYLNGAIGQIYKDYSRSELGKRLKLKNVSQDDLVLFKKVTNRAKEFYKNEETFGQTVQNVIDGE